MRKHYSGTKCTYDSIEFDSIPEKDYYISLKNDDSVSDLKVHQKFIILEGFRDYNNKKIQSITFKPDFMYIKDGILHIEDVKPNNKKLIDESFNLRWKLLMNMYKDQNVLFSLVAWDKKLKEFVVL